MRSKSIKGIQSQVERIRAGYGWKSRRDKWDYDRFIAVSRKVEEIAHRYIRAIGQHQRDAEGKTKEEQYRDYFKMIYRKYPREIYMKN